MQKLITRVTKDTHTQKLHNSKILTKIFQRFRDLQICEVKVSVKVDDWCLDPVLVTVATKVAN